MSASANPLNRYQIMHAGGLCYGYYSPTPHEQIKAGPATAESAFERARQEAVAAIESTLSSLRTLNFEQFERFRRGEFGSHRTLGGETPHAINAISIQDAWLAAGGNPGIQATREQLVEALRSLDEAVDDQDVAPRVGIRIEGGVIQTIFSDQRVNVTVVDYEVEDEDVDEDQHLVQIAQDGGGWADAKVSRYDAHVLRDGFTNIDAALAEAAAIENDEPEAMTP